ncbi:translation elongation factor G, partial [Chlamydia psittaci 09DC80]
IFKILDFRKSNINNGTCLLC